MNLQAHAIKATLQLAKVHTNPVTLHPLESLEYLNQFQCLPHNIFTTYNSFYLFFGKAHHFPLRNPWLCDFPHKVRKGKVWEPKGELIRLSDVIFQN